MGDGIKCCMFPYAYDSVKQFCTSKELSSSLVFYFGLLIRLNGTFAHFVLKRRKFAEICFYENVMNMNIEKQKELILSIHTVLPDTWIIDNIDIDHRFTKIKI